jgi:hypothetical protein
MSGLADYMAKAQLDWMGGRATMPATAGNRFLALFTTAPTKDDGTGGTEVTGGSYARVQIAGAVTAAGTISNASSTITMPNVSGSPWVVNGMNVFDLTNAYANGQIGTISTWVTTTLTLTGNASNNGTGGTDSLQFSIFPAATGVAGNEPGVTSPALVANSNAIVTFAQASANWGTVVAWGIYDSLAGGNLIIWDYLGNNKWLPFSCTSASPGVLTSPAHGYTNADSVVVTSKYGGTLPTTGGSWSGLLTVANVTTDTFTAGVNTTGTGNGLVRKVVSQSIPAGVTASFAAGSFTLTSA